ncbi:MAG: hypothetical protein K8R77_08825 [Anaerolineaceae bacterium]|nr:hypothetical protein [Anaerolineaceae bacterium]
MKKIRALLISILFFSLVLSACKTTAPQPTATPVPSETALPAPTATDVPIDTPEPTLTPTEESIPLVELLSSPDEANINGFACAVSMALNMLMEEPGEINKEFDTAITNT